VGLLERRKHGGGIKGLDDKSRGMEILMTEGFAKIKPTDPLILARHASRRKRKWPDSSGISLVKADALCVFIFNCIKKGEDRGYKNVTLETIMNTKADKDVKKITHHVSPRQMIYTKKQIGLNHEKR
jgi:hypothetical protein